MQEQLKEELKSFGNITSELIAVLNRDSYDELDRLFQRRQQVIDAIDKLEHTKEEFSVICKEYKILDLEEELTKLLMEKKLAAKAQMDSFLDNKNVNKLYNNKFSVDSIYFNKKL